MNHYPPPGIEILPGTDFWLVEGDTHFGAWSKAHGTIITDPHLFRALKPHIMGFKVAWDVGACIGDHTRWYLDQGMQVVAVEPFPTSYECLKHNCPEAMCLNVAASDETGSLQFSTCENVGASRVTAGGEWSVPSWKLDDHPDLPAPCYVKIDCEGFELRVLKGMERTLREHRPVLFVEINKGALAANGATRDDVVLFLKEIGYRNFTGYPLGISWDEEQFDILIQP